MVFEFADGGFTIVGGDDRVAEPFESFAGEIAKAFVVFSNEDQFGAAAHRLDVIGSSFDFPWQNGQRKIHAKGGADVQLAVDVQEAAVLANNTVDRRQAQAGALTVSLVVKKGSKMRIECGGDPCPVPVSVTASMT